MRLELATEKDNLELCQFYQEFSIPGPMDLKPNRYSDFSAPYRLIGNEERTFVLRSLKNNKIQAFGTFIFRDVAVDGKVVKIALAKDLRVANNRSAIIEWSQHFLPALKQVHEKYGAQHVVSTINMEDPTALNTFVRPRNMRRPIPRYYLYRKFNLVSLHGKYPWAPKPIAGLRIREGSAATEGALIDYLIRRSSYRPFATIFDENSFRQKLQQLKGMKISDFLIAFDSLDNVVGCLAPWSGSGIQDYIPIQYSLLAHNFRQALKFFWLLGMTRRLAKPVASTAVEQPLKFRYLTNLYVDNEDIFESLVWRAWEKANKDEFLLYSQVEQDYRISPPLSWISAKTSHALYSVVSPDQEFPEFLNPSISLNPEIEPYLIL